jgi:hypothetical protein
MQNTGEHQGARLAGNREPGTGNPGPRTAAQENRAMGVKHTPGAMEQQLGRPPWSPGPGISISFARAEIGRRGGWGTRGLSGTLSLLGDGGGPEDRIYLEGESYMPLVPVVRASLAIPCPSSMPVLLAVKHTVKHTIEEDRETILCHDAPHHRQFGVYGVYVVCGLIPEGPGGPGNHRETYASCVHIWNIA